MDVGGAGTINSHWRDEVFDPEIMTGFLSDGFNPLSEVSVQSLADLGYTVDVSQADPFTLAPAIRIAGQRRGRQLINDVISDPIRRIDASGRVVGVIGDDRPMENGRPHGARGCGGGNSSGSDPEACAPLEAAADGTLNADGMAGDYSLRLVATSGAKRGGTSGGTVQLTAHDSARSMSCCPTAGPARPTRSRSMARRRSTSPRWARPRPANSAPTIRRRRACW